KSFCVDWRKVPNVDWRKVPNVDWRKVPNVDWRKVPNVDWRKVPNVDWRKVPVSTGGMAPVSARGMVDFVDWKKDWTKKLRCFLTIGRAGAGSDSTGYRLTAGACVGRLDCRLAAGLCRQVRLQAGSWILVEKKPRLEETQERDESKQKRKGQHQMFSYPVIMEGDAIQTVIILLPSDTIQLCQQLLSSTVQLLSNVTQFQHGQVVTSNWHKQLEV
ncbi:hypothetical protein FHG87_021788, partial [Trinorchestia longiramus]